MKTAAPFAWTLAAVFASLALGCAAPKRIPAPEAPAPRARTRVVLLPDSDTKSVGRVRISNDAGTVELSSERGSTTVFEDSAPGPGVTMSDADVARTFGDAISALPAPPTRFTLHFRLASEELTEESQEQISDVLQAILRRSTPYVTVVGHTDTTGKDADNFALGLARAQVVRKLLVGSGLAPSSIEMLSLGERDLLIHTPDDTPEPRNRRVEIAVR